MTHANNLRLDPNGQVASYVKTYMEKQGMREPDRRGTGRIVATCATIRERTAALRDMVESIRDQVDRLFIYANDYEEETWEELDGLCGCDIRFAPGISFQDAPRGDLSDAGKFYAKASGDDYILHLDDDLLYPADYARRLIEAIEHYGRRAVCTFHGRCFDTFPISSYYRHHPRRQYRCLAAVAEDTAVHVGGTGVMGYHRSTVDFSFSDFPSPHMADVHAAVKLQKAGIPCVVIAHEAGYIKHSRKVDKRRTLHHRYQMRDDEQTRRLNALGSLQTFAEKLYDKLPASEAH